MAEYKEIGYNKKANYDYEILEKFEAGVVLRGSEVKSLRSHRVNLLDSYAGLSRDCEVFIYHLYIPEYSMSNIMNHDPRRSRKLLLKKVQISRLVGLMKKGGYTLVPISMYFNEKGFVKMSVGLGKGKKNIDKRETIKQREWNREKSRLLKKNIH